MKTIYLTEFDLEDLEKCGTGSCYAHPLTGQIGTVAYVRVEDAAQAVRESDGAWQPIESAPHDGKPVLLFARYIHASASVIVVGAHLDSRWINTAFGGAAIQQIVPSHWMPLPPFPGQHKNIA